MSHSIQPTTMIPETIRRTKTARTFDSFLSEDFAGATDEDNNHSVTKDVHIVEEGRAIANEADNIANFIHHGGTTTVSNNYDQTTPQGMDTKQRERLRDDEGPVSTKDALQFPASIIINHVLPYLDHET